ILPLFLYLLAVTLWLSVPFEVLMNSFYMRISAPTFIPFPYSDSSYYDQMAQSLLIGHPYQGIIPTRPLYIVFLTVLHLVFRENYPNILTGQTFVLASMPVALYFLGKKLHSRAAGVTIAMIFIFRELTSLLISSDTRVTNTRMILVDLPTLLLLLVSCIFTFRWLERKNPKDAFVAGGLFGVLLLLRTQSMQILPLIFVAALFVLGWRNRRFYLQGFLFIVGLAITITPWLIHNYLQTGSPAFDAAFQLKLVVAQYSAFGNLDVSNYNFEGMGLGRILLEFMIRDPKHVFGFISNHFLASQINSLLVLPLIEPFNGLFKPINLYWMNWDGSLDWYNAVLLIVYLVIISIGLGAAWRRWRWLGLLPLVYSVGYALATALARFSSWRYDFPSDWIAYFYFGIGFAELLRHAALLVGEADPAPDTLTVTEKQNAGHPYVIPALALVFILIGSLPWMIKGITSPKYPDQSPDGLSARISTVDQSPPREEIEAFVSQPGSFIQVGRLLYPRFFPKDAGLVSANPSPAYAIREYPRLGFFLLNQHSTPVVFPTRSFRSPMLHAEDVIVLGCQRGSYVEARAIILPDLDLYYAGIPLTTPCSP
ncbi:MAG: hypothetical protein FIB03_11805, partial [Anaerolineae bacterium]|nr:hypothetical protein [Anaerolineae bacterium]